MKQLLGHLKLKHHLHKTSNQQVKEALWEWTLYFEGMREMSTQECREDAALLYQCFYIQADIPALDTLYGEFAVEHFQYFYQGLTSNSELEDWVKEALLYRLSKEQEDFILRSCGGESTLLQIKKAEHYNSLPPHPDDDC